MLTFQAAFHCRMCFQFMCRDLQMDCWSVWTLLACDGLAVLPGRRRGAENQAFKCVLTSGSVQYCIHIMLPTGYYYTAFVTVRLLSSARYHRVIMLYKHASDKVHEWQQIYSLVILCLPSITSAWVSKYVVSWCLASEQFVEGAAALTVSNAKLAFAIFFRLAFQ